MVELKYFLAGMCVAGLLISLGSLVIIWLLARHAPLMDCDDDK